MLSVRIVFQPWWAFYTPVFPWCFSLVFMYLLVVGEGLHGFEQQLCDVPQESYRDSKGQFLFGEVEHTGTGCQLHVQCGRMILHPRRYQLQMERAGTWVSIWRNAVIFTSMRTFRMSGLDFSMAWVRLKRWKRASLTNPSLSLYLLNASQICVSLASPVTCKNRTKLTILQSTTTSKCKQHVIKICCVRASTFKLPSPDRKSANPASVASRPTKVMPGLASTKALTAASVTCLRPDTSRDTSWGRMPGVSSSCRATSDVNCLSSEISRCCKPSSWTNRKMMCVQLHIIIQKHNDELSG